MLCVNYVFICVFILALAIVCLQQQSESVRKNRVLIFNACFRHMTFWTKYPKWKHHKIDSLKTGIRRMPKKAQHPCI